jgi:uncharacterized protein
MRFGGVLIALILALAPVLGVAGESDLSEIPALHARVTDVTGTLTAPQRDAIESKLAAFEQRKGAQIAVLIVPTTEPETIEQYATRVFESWKLGRKGVDDGVLVIVAKNDRRVRIEVAYGLEGAIPDAAAKRVAHDYMSPRFAAGDLSGGITSGIAALVALIDDEPLPPSSVPSHGPLDLPWWHPLYFAVGLLLGGLSAVLVLLLFTRPRIHRVLLGRLPERARPFAIGAVNALPIGLLLRNPLSALAAMLTAAGLAAVAGLSKPPSPSRRMRAYAGATSGLAVSGGSDGGSSYSGSGSSESSGSSGGDFSGGGGSSGGGGASDSW